MILQDAANDLLPSVLNASLVLFGLLLILDTLKWILLCVVELPYLGVEFFLLIVNERFTLSVLFLSLHRSYQRWK